MAEKLQCMALDAMGNRAFRTMRFLLAPDDPTQICIYVDARHANIATHALPGEEIARVLAKANHAMRMFEGL